LAHKNGTLSPKDFILVQVDEVSLENGCTGNFHVKLLQVPAKEKET